MAVLKHRLIRLSAPVLAASIMFGCKTVKPEKTARVSVNIPKVSQSTKDKDTCPIPIIYDKKTLDDMKGFADRKEEKTAKVGDVVFELGESFSFGLKITGKVVITGINECGVELGSLNDSYDGPTVPYVEVSYDAAMAFLDDEKIVLFEPRWTKNTETADITVTYVNITKFLKYTDKK